MPVRVLLVVASTPVRALLRRILSEAGEFELWSETGDPSEAGRLLEHRSPDVALVDVDSASGQNEIGGMLELVRTVEVPIAILSNPDLPSGFEAAHEPHHDRPVVILPRPTVPAGWEQLRLDLPGLLKSLGRRRRSRTSCVEPAEFREQSQLRIVGIGASAGGPGALRQVLTSIGPALSDLRTIVIQHIGAEFEDSLVSWLSRDIIHAHVALARDGETLGRGALRIAPQGRHLALTPGDQITIALDANPRNGRHRPSVDVFFRSLVGHDPGRTAAVLLSGMGRDGADGMLELQRSGCATVVQDEASCAVFGMPRAALDIGAASAALPPESIGRFLAKLRTKDSP